MKPTDCKTAEDWIAVYRGQVDEISAKLAELSGVALAWKLRTEIAEAEVAALKATIAKARNTLTPDIQLTNASYQAGYRAAADAVRKALGDV